MGEFAGSARPSPPNAAGRVLSHLVAMLDNTFLCGTGVDSVDKGDKNGGTGSFREFLFGSLIPQEWRQSVKVVKVCFCKVDRQCPAPGQKPLTIIKTTSGTAQSSDRSQKLENLQTFIFGS